MRSGDPARGSEPDHTGSARGGRTARQWWAGEGARSARVVSSFSTGAAHQWARMFTGAASIWLVP